MACPASWYAMISFSSGEMILFFFSNPPITLSMASWKSLISTESLFLRAAIKAASLQTLAISAPAKPGVCSANLKISSVVEIFIGPKCTLKMASLPTKSGRSIEICRSNLPGRNKAASNTSGRLVAAKIMIPRSVPKPSISTSNWFKVFSLSSLLIIIFLPLALPMASISSIKMMQGAFSLACLKRSRTRLAPTPTNISTKSLPLRLKNGTWASPATALASKVLPVPGGPINNAPLGIFPPRAVYFFGFFKKSTISITSTLASSRPATSPKLIFTLDALSKRVAFDLPILKMPPGPPLPPPGPPTLRIIITNNKPINKIGRRVDIICPNNSPSSVGESGIWVIAGFLL